MPSAVSTRSVYGGSPALRSRSARPIGQFARRSFGRGGRRLHRELAALGRGRQLLAGLDGRRLRLSRLGVGRLRIGRLRFRSFCFRRLRLHRTRLDRPALERRLCALRRVRGRRERHAFGRRHRRQGQSRRELRLLARDVDRNVVGHGPGLGVEHHRHHDHRRARARRVAASSARLPSSSEEDWDRLGRSCAAEAEASGDFLVRRQNARDIHAPAEVLSAAGAPASAARAAPRLP